MTIRLLSAMVASTLLVNACMWNDHDHASESAKAPAPETAQQPAKDEHNHNDEHFHGKVNYTCDQGKKLTVTYHFDDKGAPTEAEAMIDDKAVEMKVNAKRSDGTGFFFGDEGEYMMGTNLFTQKTYLKSEVILTAPDNKILFKNCEVK